MKYICNLSSCHCYHRMHFFLSISKFFLVQPWCFFFRSIAFFSDVFVFLFNNNFDSAEKFPSAMSISAKKCFDFSGTFDLRFTCTLYISEKYIVYICVCIFRTYPIKLLMKWYTPNKLVSVNNKSDLSDGNALCICTFGGINKSLVLQLDTVFVVKFANVVDVVVVDAVSNKTRWLYTPHK